MSGTSKADALGAIMEQLLLTLQEKRLLDPDEIRTLLKKAHDGLSVEGIARNATVQAAKTYIEGLGHFIKEH